MVNPSNRTLAHIADELRSVLVKASDIIKSGQLLKEAKKRARIEKVAFLPWLEKQFAMTERTAQKYMKAATFIEKNELDSDVKLTPSALYRLSEDAPWKMVSPKARRLATKEVLSAAIEVTINEKRADEIIEEKLDQLIEAEDARRSAARERRLRREARDPARAKRKKRERFMAAELAAARQSGQSLNEDELKVLLSERFEENWSNYWKLNHGSTGDGAGDQGSTNAHEHSDDFDDGNDNGAEVAIDEADDSEACVHDIAKQRAKFVKVLGMLGSQHLGERASAASQAHQMQLALGVTWDELIIPSHSIARKKPQPPRTSGSTKAAA
jgi:type IV secretory pathway VirB10-like protein